jgi:DNA-binding GntR family transcriptional regulator
MIAAAVRVGDAARARQLAESHVNDAWLRLSKEVS